MIGSSTSVLKNSQGRTVVIVTPVTSMSNLEADRRELEVLQGLGGSFVVSNRDFLGDSDGRAIRTTYTEVAHGTPYIVPKFISPEAKADATVETPMTTTAQGMAGRDYPMDKRQIETAPFPPGAEYVAATVALDKPKPEAQNPWATRISYHAWLHDPEVKRVGAMIGKPEKFGAFCAGNIGPHPHPVPEGCRGSLTVVALSPAEAEAKFREAGWKRAGVLGAFCPACYRRALAEGIIPAETVVRIESATISASRLADARLELWKAARRELAKRKEWLRCKEHDQALGIYEVEDFVIRLRCPASGCIETRCLTMNTPKRLRGFVASVFDIGPEHGGTKTE